MNGVNARKIASYALLPGIIPRARALFVSGFGYIAFLMANIYNMVRLLPGGHPYLDPKNIGRFGIRHVIGEAANNLVLSRKNIDQIFIFGVLLAGVVIMALQIVILLYSFFIRPAMALPPGWGGIIGDLLEDWLGGGGGGGGSGGLFNTAAPTNDIAFLLLDRVFGVPDFFCNAAGDCSSIEASLPWPLHNALHEMLQFYSTGLLLVGALIFLYFVVVVIAETAVSGTPFGQRFQNIWVPIRLVVALGLLVPLNHGLNSGQYITLMAAKMGSGFASNGWVLFNRTIVEHTPGGISNPAGERGNMLALPKPPSVAPMVQFMSMAHACAYSYWLKNPKGSHSAPPSSSFYIRPYLVKNPMPWGDGRDHLEVTETTSYTDALDFYDNGDITIVFGERGDTDDTRFDKYKGRVKPLCGSIRVHIVDLKHRDEINTYGGAGYVQRYYFNMIKGMWYDNIPGGVRDLGRGFAEHSDPAGGHGDRPAAEVTNNAVANYQSLLNLAINTAWQQYNDNGIDFEITADVFNRGWAGAGIWYNTISDINGGFIGAVTEVPSTDDYPLVMEQVRKENRAYNSNISSLEQFVPGIAGTGATEIEDGDMGLDIARILNNLFQYWYVDDTTGKPVSGKLFEDAMNLVFGTDGLFAMRGENRHIHPLAQLSALGKGLVDSAIRNVAGSSVAAALGGPSRILEGFFDTMANVASEFLMSTAFIGLTAGFVLYYVLPFLPFLYFFFAVSTWIKTIFEAMVGVPLWALAHLRIDGNGLPGQAAANGYFLIFEIFLRPILTVFGLIAAMIIFTAQVRVLHFIWGIVVDNLTGYEPSDWANIDLGLMDMPRGIIDQFFYTVIYAIVVYMLATASFKLIDKIPDNLLRWMGAGVSSFSDINEDPTEGLTRYAALGGMTIGEQTARGVRDVIKGTGDTVGGSLDEILKKLGTGGKKGP